jgi:hypothetical protein
VLDWAIILGAFGLGCFCGGLAMAVWYVLITSRGPRNYRG